MIKLYLKVKRNYIIYNIYNYLLVVDYYESNNLHIDLPSYEKKLLNFETKELNYLMNLKSNDIIRRGRNNMDNKINNSNLINSFNKNSAHILKSKIINDNSKLIGKQNSFINKRNRQNSEKIINHNINESNIKILNNNIISQKLGLISIPIKQNNLVLFEQNKNASLLKTQGFSKSNEKRKNKFLFSDIKENQLRKTLDNSKNNKNTSSKEKKYKQIIYQKNDKDNKFNKQINEVNSKNIDEINSKNNSMNNINKKKLLPSININEKNIDKIPSILKKNNNNKDNEVNKSNMSINSNTINNENNKSSISINNRDNTNNEIQIQINSLSVKEKACYFLSQSKILRLCERIIFSRANSKISNLISIKDILKSNEAFMKNKIKELEEKIINYNKIIEKPFSPSKTAIISLNLIMKEDEDDFKNVSSSNYLYEEDENNYYYIYIELFFILLDDQNCENNDINLLYEKLKEKGFVSLKEYLYQFFVIQKFKTELFNENKIEKFNELFEQLPNLIKYEGEIKNNKFICFSYFILYEANNYWINYKEYIQLKNKTQYYIDSLKKKILKYK